MTKTDEIVDEIKSEIAKLKEKLKVAERKKREASRPVRTLESYTVEEKVEIFDKFYNDALAQLLEVEGGDPLDEDRKIYSWEDMMGLLVNLNQGREFWDYYNQCCREAWKG